jgi:hypothetical protein
MREWLVGLSLACAACSTSEFEPQKSVVTKPPAAMSGEAGTSAGDDEDSDRDGVCDGYEVNLGSDPLRSDTDRDGLPDFSEIVAGFDLTDPNTPAPDQVAYIVGSAGTTLDFPLRMTLEGSGQGYSGEFRVRSDALDPRGYTAKDFFEGAIAISGEPPDNVRGVQSESERFMSVMGKTRLSFQLRFRVRSDELPRCAIAYPFEYRLKADDGRFATARDYVLVVVPESSNGERRSFCVPEVCF